MRRAPSRTAARAKALVLSALSRWKADSSPLKACARPARWKIVAPSRLAAAMRASQSEAPRETASIELLIPVLRALPTNPEAPVMTTRDNALDMGRPKENGHSARNARF